MENVKKCKNFLSTLIKLASSGKQSTETAASVRELVKDLLVSESHTRDTVIMTSTCQLPYCLHFCQGLLQLRLETSLYTNNLVLGGKTGS